MDKKQELIKEAIKLLEKSSGKKVVLKEYYEEPVNPEKTQYFNNLISSLKQFYQATNALNNIFLNTPSDIEINDWVVENYPFVGDFNELTMDIKNWVSSSIKYINNKTSSN